MKSCQCKKHSTALNNRLKIAGKSGFLFMSNKYQAQLSFPVFLLPSIHFTLPTLTIFAQYVIKVADCFVCIQSASNKNQVVNQWMQYFPIPRRVCNAKINRPAHTRFYVERVGSFYVWWSWLNICGIITLAAAVRQVCYMLDEPAITCARFCILKKVRQMRN